MPTLRIEPIKYTSDGTNTEISVAPTPVPVSFTTADGTSKVAYTNNLSTKLTVKVQAVAGQFWVSWGVTANSAIEPRTFLPSGGSKVILLPPSGKVYTTTAALS